jgi:hypothetical protein
MQKARAGGSRRRQLRIVPRLPAHRLSLSPRYPSRMWSCPVSVHETGSTPDRPILRLPSQ